MSDYKLTIIFSSDAVRELNEKGAQVAIIKSEHHSGDGKPRWVTFSPFENNVISWHSDYGIYASPHNPSLKRQIFPGSTKYPAVPAVVYPFKNNVFDEPEKGGTPNSYTIANEDDDTVVAGLLQDVNINGELETLVPINAVTMPPKTLATFTPTEVITVFIIIQSTSGGVVVTSESGLTVFDMSQTPDLTIHYNGNGFKPAE